MSDGTMVINNMNLVFEGIKGINIIKEESQRYPPVENPLHKLFECPFLIGSPFYYNWFLNIVNPVYYQFKDIPLKMALLQWMENDLVHRTYKITFKKLFHYCNAKISIAWGLNPRLLIGILLFFICIKVHFLPLNSCRNFISMRMIFICWCW